MQNLYESLSDEAREVMSKAGKGIIGVSASMAGIQVSMQTVISWLQLMSLLIGIAVGITTLVSLIKHNKKKGKRND